MLKNAASMHVAVIGIDKEQAFKHIGEDSLAVTYKPNPSVQLYSTVFDLFRKKKLSLNVGALLPAIKAIEVARKGRADHPDDLRFAREGRAARVGAAGI